MTPFYLAFPEGYAGAPYFIDLIINIIFSVDIVAQFFIAFYDEDYQIID